MSEPKVVKKLRSAVTLLKSVLRFHIGDRETPVEQEFDLTKLFPMWPKFNAAQRGVVKNGVAQRLGDGCAGKERNERTQIRNKIWELLLTGEYMDPDAKSKAAEAKRLQDAAELENAVAYCRTLTDEALVVVHGLGGQYAKPALIVMQERIDAAKAAEAEAEAEAETEVEADETN